jgi:integrase
LKNLLQYKNSKNWYFRFYDDQGKRRTVSLGTDDEAEAIKKARGIQAGEAVRRVENIQVNTPMVRLVDDYLVAAKTRRRKPMRPETAKITGFILKKFVREAGVTTAQGVNAKAAKAWIDALAKDGKSQETLRAYTQDLKTFAKWLSGRGLCGPLEIELPDLKAEIRKPWVRKDVVARIIRAVAPKIGPHSTPEGKLKAARKAEELKFILYCGFHAGLRRKEIGAAKVSWFDLKAGLLHVANDKGFTSKDSENRTIPLTDEFLEFLKGFLSGRKANEFCLKHERPVARGKYRYDFQGTVRSHFRMLSVDLDIHGMRRSFASNLVSEGESIFIVSQWLGDGVQVVQKHYAYLAPHSGSINRLVA